MQWPDGCAIGWKGWAPACSAIYVGRVVKGITIIVAALCVAFYMASIAFAGSSRSDSVTRGLLCIHHFEGSWTDPGAPYYGGLQMDSGFMAAYGWMEIHGTRIYFSQLWGTADHWPVWAQLQAGRNGFRARGWWPWPNTARMCGLL